MLFLLLFIVIMFSDKILIGLVGLTAFVSMIVLWKIYGYCVVTKIENVLASDSIRCTASNKNACLTESYIVRMNQYIPFLDIEKIQGICLGILFLCFFLRLYRCTP